MASSYFRAMATCSMLKKQLEKETHSRQAMELCFKKIHKSLDLYKGHFINRLRFHMNRHHTEYLRKVRVQAKKGNFKSKESSAPTTRRSERVSQLEELTAELEQTKKALALKSQQAEELCKMLEIAEQHPDGPIDTSVPCAKHDQGTQTSPIDTSVPCANHDQSTQTDESSESVESFWDGIFVGP